MLVIAHAITGAAIAVTIPSPEIAIPLALSSHFLLDMIPHWQEIIGDVPPGKITYLRLLIEFPFTGLLIWAITLAHPEISNLIWLSSLLAVAPDFDVAIKTFLPIIYKRLTLFRHYYDWHGRIQKETFKLYGVFTQLIVVLTGLLIGLYF